MGIHPYIFHHKNSIQNCYINFLVKIMKMELENLFE